MENVKIQFENLVLDVDRARNVVPLRLFHVGCWWLHVARVVVQIVVVFNRFHVLHAVISRLLPGVTCCFTRVTNCSCFFQLFHACHVDLYGFHRWFLGVLKI